MVFRLTSPKSSCTLTKQMKMILRGFGLAYFLAFGLQLTWGASTNSLRVMVELRDGSRVVGTSLDEKYVFHSEILGELKLPLGRIRSLESLPKTNLFKIDTIGGDQLTAVFAMKEIRLETSFGKVSPSVETIRRMLVTPSGPADQTKLGLVALWPGDGNYLDTINGNSAMPVGEVSFNEGIHGQSFSFNGNGAYLRIPANPTCDVGKGEGFTLEGWINPVTLMRNMPVAEYTGNPGSSVSGVQFWISIGGGPGCFYANIVGSDGTGHMMTSSAGLVVANVWQHVALSYDKSSGMAVIYLNGNTVMSKNFDSFTARTDLDLLLGARILFSSASNPSDLFEGRLAEFGIYDRALSADEIQAIYAGAKDGVESAH